MGHKPKISICWLAACGGCDSAILDLDLHILELAESAEIVYWPIALDFKMESLTRRPDNDIDLAIISGSIRTDEQLQLAHLLRRKSKRLLAFGSCACTGGTAGLANFDSAEKLLRTVYATPALSHDTDPHLPREVSTCNGHELHLPGILPHLHTLDQAVLVDWYLPGCPPPVDLIVRTVHLLLEDKLPDQDTTVLPQTAVCETCSRRGDTVRLRSFNRPHLTDIPEDVCFLAHGVICLGPATRSGCGTRCPSAGSPCRGCFGPPEGVEDAGARALSALAALMEGSDGGDIPDTVGTFYRFTAPSSILGSKKLPVPEEQ